MLVMLKTKQKFNAKKKKTKNFFLKNLFKTKTGFSTKKKKKKKICDDNFEKNVNNERENVVDR